MSEEHKVTIAAGDMCARMLDVVAALSHGDIDIEDEGDCMAIFSAAYYIAHGHGANIDDLMAASKIIVPIFENGIDRMTEAMD